MDLNLNDKYPENSLTTVATIIQKGDELIKITSNRAYDILKMLEPFTLSRLFELTEDPELYQLNDGFREHLETVVVKDPAGHKFLRELQELLSNVTNLDDLAAIFGSFRIWGHPYIEVEEGLEAVKELLRRDVQIDTEYANLLASDLARICLHDHFRRTGEWGVDKTKISSDSPFYKFIIDQVWPTGDAINQLPDKWNELPLIGIYTVPTDINLATLYSDKSHSGTRSELYTELSSDRHNPLKSKKVLKTLLDKEVISPADFLTEISENGLDPDHLIIGLREKERELKRKGRFFTLMFWRFREYIVLTEFLIKKFFLPHFKGITMADGLTTLLKKLIKVTDGQSERDRKPVSISNHIDYEKWNNLQRGQSVGPVFRVMDRFLGFRGPVIERTHSFFENTLVYFAGRPDKLNLKRDIDGLITIEENGYGWNGQAGGFEGVRQKGWTVCGGLLIRREAERNNVKINLLAQGDNQIIITNFKLRDSVKAEKDNILNVNKLIMSRIFNGAERMGLAINRDETMSSSRTLVYGKIIVSNGNFVNTETKKWARATAISNDQIPTSSNVMGAVATTAIGSSQFEDNVRSSFLLYCGVGMIAMHQSFYKNPLTNLGSSFTMNVPAVLAWLFLDRSIGGFTGMSPTRLLIRQFPDPVTESLTFWKIMSDSPIFTRLSNIAFNPTLSRRVDFSSLIENPTGLNILA